jgi:hypothetical protein
MGDGGSIPFFNKTLRNVEKPIALMIIPRVRDKKIIGIIAERDGAPFEDNNKELTVAEKGEIEYKPMNPGSK